MVESNLFDLNKPIDLYQIIHEVYREYIDRPTERNFLFLVLGFTHLREWISKASHFDIEKKQKAGIPLTEGEQFFTEIYELPSFKVIQGLCNQSKHYISRGAISKAEKTSGLQAGLSKIGDKTDQLYFLIDGKDSRDYFIDLIGKYNEWFSRTEHQD